ncbi:MAG: cytochrome c family protein [Devosia nanyangense]|uniref:Cytochrome c family protein n=1 Tax=Devosia nanyangense TaxID=1228055 RepID=A0A933KYX8_9HYPH|nr:cytochrome c family protein [Devosia nanyangense]
MDSFELNKIIGAILGTLLFVMGIGFVAEAIYHPVTGQGPGYDLPAPPEEGNDDGGPPPPAEIVSIGTLLAAADPKAGEASAKKCQACHDLTSGGPNKTGPNLYDVVERVIGSHPGFGYSPGMVEHQGKGDTWTYDALNQFIISPKAFVPGTKMAFAGVKDDKERANIIAFLATLSASPKPFPPADAAPVPDASASSEAPADTSSEAPAASSEAPAASSEAPASSESSAAQ